MDYQQQAINHANTLPQHERANFLKQLWEVAAKPEKGHNSNPSENIPIRRIDNNNLKPSEVIDSFVSYHKALRRIDNQNAEDPFNAKIQKRILAANLAGKQLSLETATEEQIQASELRRDRRIRLKRLTIDFQPNDWSRFYEYVCLEGMETESAIKRVKLRRRGLSK
jgi:hypothetical protein